MAVAGAPLVEPRIYRSPISRGYRVEALSRKPDKRGSRRHNEVMVYNWNCRHYDPDDPHPGYGSMRPVLHHWDPEPRLQYTPFGHRSQEQSPQLTAVHVGTQEQSLVLTALDDLPIGPCVDPLGVVSEENGIAQADRSNAEWRYVTREFIYPHGEGDKITERHTRRDYPLVIYGESGDGTGQQRSPTVSYASTIGTDQSSVFDDDNNNGTLSYVLGGTSEPERGDSDNYSEENANEISGHINFPFPPLPRPSPRLFCEFVGYHKCKRTFAPEDFRAWMEHIIMEHMEGKLPVEHLCWFCDDLVFRAKDPSDQGNIRANFEQSLCHIRDHLVEDGLEVHNMRPDYSLNEHLRESGLISDPVFNRVLRFTELPNVVDGIVPSTFISPEILRRDELSKIIVGDRHRETSYSECWQRESPESQLLWDYQNGVHPPTIRKPSIAALVNRLRKFSWPRIKDNSLRVSWTCRCGEPLYIDVSPEQKQTAFEFAHAAAGSTASVQISSNGGSGYLSKASSSGSNIVLGTATINSHMTKPITPTHSVTQANRISLPPELAPGTKKYLLLCVNTGPYQIRLGHVDLTNVVWDVSLYSLIRETYQSMRGRLARNMFIVPRTIEYVKFELVNRSYTGECIGNYEKDSIPGKEEMARMEYTLSPYPPRIGTLPIQPHLFMHSFLNPGDHLGGLAVLRLPKKVGRRLKCTTQPRNPLDVPYGWGVYIVEGVDMFLVSLLLAGVLSLVTLAVVLWSMLKGDVQGGTGIGQYALAVVAIATGAFAWKPLRDMC
ncbi:hypothetical protein E0Z10_g360 [Xylaria hypoxylon]|uniref:Uncharacterized protein n=1 Tax=Xylaria hypoxylon TaxID=37992 RepID=A0A4Z0Z835_9PEZI|nr:hypothetical protein E0Z10_g360 [Xylaria hypoxylon]